MSQAKLRFGALWRIQRGVLLGPWGRWGVVVAALFLTAATPAAAEGGADGPKFFEQHKCVLCHGVAAAEIEAKTTSEKLLGPDLSGYATEDAAALGKYLRKEEEKDGQAHKREFKGGDDELQAMLDWLGSLESAASAEAADSTSESDGSDDGR